ncbi:MAG: aminotransferase, partial [Satyrvirus sp.]
MQASIGIDALDKLEEWINIRRTNAGIFNSIFEDLPLLRLTIPSNINDKIYHSYYKYYCFIQPKYLVDGITRNDIILEL